jgi:Mrp family chromosome partitioning ATPase
MDAVEFVKAVRRRWQVLAATILLALGVGWIGADTLERRSDQRTYRATATLLGSGRLEDPGIGNINTLAALVTTGEVPARVAEKVGFAGDPKRLTRGEPPTRPEGIVTTADDNTGIMTISATSTDPAEAERLANTFAGELIGFLEGRKASSASLQAEAVRGQMDGLQQEIRDLDAAIAKRPPNSEFLRAQRDAKIRVYGFLYDRYQSLVLGLTGSLGSSLEIVEAASPQLITASFLGLPSGGIRMVVAPLIGLLGGLAMVLMLERFDARIWAKPAAEHHLGFPVIAQIPFLKRRKRKALIVTSSNGGSAADAYRLLAASLSRGASQNAGEIGADTGTGRSRPEVILVTSPGPGEGKTTVAANLAVGLAELGKKVLAISCDFRRPRLHQMLGVQEGDGLADALASHSLPLDGKPVLDGFIRPSGFKDLGVIPSGSPTKKPGELLSSEAMPRALQEAREQSDVVVLDGPSALVSETAHLLPKVDTVLVVARVGSSVEVAERASEHLRRLSANVAGIALVGTHDGGGPLVKDFAPTPAIKKKRLWKRFLDRALWWRKLGSGTGRHLTADAAPSTGGSPREAPPLQTDPETAESPELDREGESDEKVHDHQEEGPERSDEHLEPDRGQADVRDNPLDPAMAAAAARQIAAYLFGGQPIVDAHAGDDPGNRSPRDRGLRERPPEPGPGGDPMGDIPT